ncbi:MAG TPA: hypothetical protein DEH78_22765, partial [Solibacterales bacterium]|nr:hypothetical protein [Bryobacterales bacterium]
GFGTVNASTGEYTAPASVGSVTAVTVRATSQTTPAGTGDAAITVKPLLIPASESLNSALQDRTIEVTRNGSWTAAANNGWISVVSGPSGSGPGTVTYRVQANPDVGSRNGSLTVAGAAFAVTQSGGGTATLSPAGNSVPAGGGSYSVSVTSGGAWVVTGVPAWITGVTPMSGFGNGTVNYTVTGNGTAAPRSATLQIGNRDFAVTQAACATSMTPLAADFGASGGAGSVTVVSGCTAWTATAPSWIAITNGSGGATAGQTVNYTVSGNAGAVRAGAIVVNEASHTVNQAGCTPTLAPVAATHLGSGGIGSFAISGGCAISAPTVSEAWITITGSTQTAVSYSVASNPGATDRYGSIWVNGAEFRITQLVTETIEIVPAQVTLYPEGRQTFELRKTRLGVVTNVTGEGSWSLSPAVGTMPSAGYYWAPSAGGFTEGQQVVITASYGGQQVAGQVTLRYPPGTSGAQVYPVGQTGMTGFFMLRMPKPPGAYPDRRQWLAFHAATPDGVTDCYFDISLSGSPSATLAGASLWVFPQITRSTVPPVYGNANARCAVDTVTSFFYGPPNGNYWDIELPVKFLPAFAGTKTVWHRSWTEMGPIPDWVTKGTWTVGQ